MDLEKICRQTIDIVKTTAAFIQNESIQFQQNKIEVKSHNSLVSYVDVTAEKMLVEACIKILPVAGFITEENTFSLEGRDWQWIIDPLDGTTNFMHHLPVYSVSVGLMHKDEIMMGIVHEINRDECFYAWKDGGAFMNDQSIKVSPAGALKDSLIATGFPYEKMDYMQKYMQTLSAIMDHSQGVRRLGSAAVDLAYVACGRFEGFFEYNLNPWDVAGGICLVREAGGTVQEFDGGNNVVFGRSIAASNGKIQKEFLKDISLFLL